MRYNNQNYENLFHLLNVKMVFVLKCFFSVSFLFFFFSSIRLSAEIVEETVDSKSSFNHTESVPADQIFKSVDDYKMDMSDDGQFIASMKLIDNNYHLLITDVDKGKVVNIYNLGNKYPRSYMWKGRKLIVDLNKIIYEVDLVNTNIKRLLGPREKRDGIRTDMSMKWKLLSIAKSSPEIIVVSGRDGWGSLHRVYNYNIFTGVLKEINNVSKAPKGTVWWYDDFGNNVGGTRKVNGGLEIYKPDGNGLVKVYTLNSSNPVEGLPVDESYLSDRVMIEGVEKDKLFLSTNLKSDRYQLYEYSFAENQLSSPIFSSEKYDAGGDYSDNYVVREGGAVFGFRFYRDQAYIHWMDERFKSIQKEIDRAVGTERNLVLDYTDDLNLILFMNDDGMRGKIYFYNRNQNKLKLLVNHSKYLEPYDFPVRRVVEYKSFDGYSIEGYLVLPHDYEGKSIASIVMPVVGVRDRFFNAFNSWASFFASQGYAVLMINHRGSEGFGLKHYISGIENGQKLMTDDIAAAAEWLVESGYSSRDSVFLFGRAFGGQTGLLASIRHPGVFRGVAVMSAPLDYNNEYKDYKKYDMTYNIEYLKVALGEKVRKSDREGISPYYLFGNISQPTLFVYGKDNMFIKENELEKKIGDTEKIEGYFQSFFVQGEKDKIKKYSNQVFLAHKIDEFFKKNIK